MKSVLILGSAPDAVYAKQLDISRINAIVALNNAWQIRDDWTHAIYPEDFPAERRPVPCANQKIITYKDYVPANNQFGGIIYAGATMAFTTAYWVLSAFKPDLMLFMGCDMIYDRPHGKSHFYGDGTADPLRDDPTLQSLPAKANRLMLLAAQENCLCANLSGLPQTRLTFPHFNPLNLDQLNLDDLRRTRMTLDATTNQTTMDEALELEKSAALFHEGGDYWNSELVIDAHILAKIDALWLKAAPSQSDYFIGE